MQFFSESLTLRPKTFELLRDLIHERFGIFYEVDKLDLLKDKLSPLVIERGFNSFTEYYYFLKYDSSQMEWNRIAEAISVAETYFLREREQIYATADVIIPQLLERAPKAQINIWSAGCATGEEPLSIAMVLDERGWFERAEIKIIGTDLSRKNLDKARRGIYKDWSFRNVPERYIRNYFKETPEGKMISDKILKRVSFEHVNLMDEERVKELAKAPIIFLRNVFIYFSEVAIKKVISIIYESMPEQVTCSWHQQNPYSRSFQGFN